jgi:hypothetical protein
LGTVKKLLTLAEKQELDTALRLARFERYAIQSLSKKVLPSERVAKCLRYVTNRAGVEVWKHLKTEKAFYNGLLVCGSVWHCPICAAKISERRKQELNQAFDLHKSNGGKIGHLILTFSHSRNDSLSDNLDKFLKAITKFRSGKRYDKISKQLGMIGSIRVFEVTYSEANGFHPHAHIAILYNNNFSLVAAELELTELWLKACKKFGLTGLEGIALKFQNGDKADDYLSKWSLESELSKSHIKKGKDNSLTPFDFLRKYRETEDNRFLALFKEYAETFKGKRQIFWSPGLKKQFLINEKSDEEIAKEKTEQADLLGSITYEEWKVILRHDARADLLDLTEKIGLEKAKENILNRKKDLTTNTN